MKGQFNHLFWFLIILTSVSVLYTSYITLVKKDIGIIENFDTNL